MILFFIKYIPPAFHDTPYSFILPPTIITHLNGYLKFINKILEKKYLTRQPASPKSSIKLLFLKISCLHVEQRKNI